MIRADVARAVACATACAVAAGGCACERTIGLSGGDGSTDTAGGDPHPSDPGPDYSGDIRYDPPDEPDWDIFEDGTGETGWEESEGTFPDDLLFQSSLDIWSDHRGVFVLQSGRTDPGIDETRAILHINDGTGWAVLRDWLPDANAASGRLTGVVGGWLFLYDGAMSYSAAFHDGAIDLFDVKAESIAAVRDDLAYATLGSEPWLAWWNGSTWSPYAGPAVPFPVHVVWADEASIFCAGDGGIVLSLEDGEWVVHGTGTLGGIWAMGGSSATDLWAGTDSGQILHFDGSAWSVTAWPGLTPLGADCNSVGIREIWAAEGEAFFATERELLHWDGASFETLACWPAEEWVTSVGGSPICAVGTSIDAIWGNSPEEVFVAISQEFMGSDRALGNHRILWWDGGEFHLM